MRLEIWVPTHDVAVLKASSRLFTRSCASGFIFATVELRQQLQPYPADIGNFGELEFLVKTCVADQDPKFFFFCAQLSHDILKLTDLLCDHALWSCLSIKLTM